MADPPRLRLKSGTVEALLLRSAPSLTPPPSAEEEVWQRLTTTLAAGSAAGATMTYAAASGGTKVLGKATWIALLKWGALLAVGAPVAGMTTHAVLRRWARPSEVTSVPAPCPSLAVVPPPAEPAVVPPPATVAAEPPSQAVEDSPKAAALPRAARAVTPRSDAVHLGTASALRAESEQLGVARSHLAAGDYRGALDEVRRLQGRFPRGRLLQEREVVAIDALAGMGDHAGARDRALSFMKRFPASPYSAHVVHIVEP
jgi:hypothetical protein